MTCKYIYKKVTYNSKEEFVDNIIKPQFLFNNSNEVSELNNQIQDLKNSLLNFELEYKQTNNLELKKQIDNFSKLILEGESQLNILKSFNKKDTKTRRILEVQSDLFQKGRDRVTLTKEGRGIEHSAGYGFQIDNLYYKYSSGMPEGEKYSVLDVKTDIRKTITKAEFESKRFENIDTKDAENQFLQLLNKKGNWVNFFIQSIVQDSVKKGYEKVLFPKGDTAAKIEGHQTLEEFKKQKEDRIKELENEILNNVEETYSIKDNYGQYEIRNSRNKVLATKSSEKEANIVLENYKKAAKTKVEDNRKEINQLKQELESVVTEGFGALRPIYNFYEETVTNILKKQGYSPKEVTDEFGNKWNEVTLNQNRDLKNILFQRDTANRIIGQADIKAMTVLIDAAYANKPDLIYHEYAHHYIAWFRNTPIVQEAIKKWGSEEKLVQAIGEQAALQKGEAWNWWNDFKKWMIGLFSDLSIKSKEELKNALTDAFLQAIDLETGQVGISEQRSKELAERASAGIFNQDLTYEQVEKLFNENPDIANQIYEKLGFNVNKKNYEEDNLLQEEENRQNKDKEEYKQKLEKEFSEAILKAEENFNKKPIQEKINLIVSFPKKFFGGKKVRDHIKDAPIGTIIKERNNYWEKIDNNTVKHLKSGYISSLSDIKVFDFKENVEIYNKNEFDKVKFTNDFKSSLELPIYINKDLDTSSTSLEIYNNFKKSVSNYNEHFEELGKQLLPYLKDVNFKIVDGLINNRAGGVYNAGENTIKISNRLNNIYKNTVFLHEGLHAVTTNHLYNFEKAFKIFVSDTGKVRFVEKPDNNSLKKLSNNQIESIKSLYDLFYNLKINNPEFNQHYGSTDVHEFIAEAFTDKNFQNYLKNIPSENNYKLSVFDKFLNILSSLFNIKNSVLTDIFYHTEIISGITKNTDNNSKTKDISFSQKQQAIEYYIEKQKGSNTQYQKINESLTPTQKENIDNLKQEDARWQKYSDEDIQRFIDQIFPESKNKEINYHNTDAIFEEFKPISPNFDTLNSIEGIYNFSTNYEFTKRYGKNRKFALLNIIDPIIEHTSGEHNDNMDRPLSEALFKMGKQKTKNILAPEFDSSLKDKDGVLNYISGEDYIKVHPISKKEWGIPGQIVSTVFDPSQIYILNSDKALQDMERFMNRDNYNSQVIENPEFNNPHLPKYVNTEDKRAVYDVLKDMGIIDEIMAQSGNKYEYFLNAYNILDVNDNRTSDDVISDIITMISYMFPNINENINIFETFVKSIKC